MSPVPFVALHVHASAYPARQRETLLAALAQGRLPMALLYQGPAQAQAWLDYHQAWSPSRADDGLRALYGRAFEAAARALPPGPAHLVGLGCGGGHKDAQALAALLAAGRPERSVHYTPLDISPELVLEAALHVGATHPGVSQSPLVADLEAHPALTPWLKQQDRPGGNPDGSPGAGRLYSCLGLVPNLRPAPLLDWLRGLLRPEDRLLVSANLSPAGLPGDHARILAQYDNAPARRWVGGAVESLGVLVPAAAALSVEAAPVSPDGSHWQVQVWARPAGQVSIALYGKRFTFGPQRRLQAFFSHRFTLGAFTALLAAARLRVLQQWVQDAGEEGIFLCAAA